MTMANMSTVQAFSYGDSNIMYEYINYYMNDYWTKGHRVIDPLTSTLPGMDTPWFFFLLTVQLSLLIKLIIPMAMVNRKPFNIKPISVVASGFAFGTTAVGMCVVLGFTPAVAMTTQCHSYKNVTSDIVEIVYKYIAYCFIFMKLFDYLKPILAALAKKEETISNMALTGLNVCVMFCWLGAKVNPGGIFILYGLLDTIYQMLAYGYLVYASASNEMKPTYRNRLYYKDLIRKFRLATVMFGVPYNIYFLFQSGCPNRDVTFVAVVYIGLYALSYPYDIRRMQIKEKIQLKLMTED